MVAAQISGFPTMMQGNGVNVFIPDNSKLEGKYVSADVELQVKINNMRL